MGVGDLVVNSNTVRDLDITSITYALPLRYANQCVQIFFLKMREKMRQPKMSKFLSLFWMFHRWLTLGV